MSAELSALARWAALGLLAAALGGCRGEVGPERPAEIGGPPVVVVALDTVRADALSRASGPAESTTPALDGLLADSVEFPSALSEMPFTLTAHLTLLTGAAPDVHGVFGAGDRLPAGVSTLAESLAAAGYATAAVVSSDWLDADFGFERGFESYEEVALGLRFADRVNAAALDAFDRMLAAGRPPFLFVHYYDAHSDPALDGNRRPYWAPEELSAELDERCAPVLCSPGGECATGYLVWASHHPDAVSPEVRGCLFEGYLAGVRDLDDGVGSLLAGLRARAIYDEALIVLASDHGEEFGEHGQFVHAQTHHESIAIPLAFKLPGGDRAGDRDGRLAQLADVVPTVLGLLGLPAPPGVTGRDLLAGPAVDEASGEPPRAALAQNKHRPERYALVRERWKLVHDYVSGRSHLYDRDADPGETIDLAAEAPDLVEELSAELDERVRGHRELRRRLGLEDTTDADVLDEAARRRLEALGYTN